MIRFINHRFYSICSGLKENTSDINYNDKVEKELKPEMKRKMKFDHAYAYVVKMARSDMVDFSALMGQSKSVYLPYKRKSYLYGEYEYSCIFHGVEECEFAGETTFSRAFDAAVKSIFKSDGIRVKFNGGKGNLLNGFILNQSNHCNLYYRQI